jgi:DNA-binding transcriptional LysR family regulator
MELRQLRHFLALAEHLHFGRAAAQLCISQPALSASILRLEEDFGLRLFERDSKGVRVTAGGELMLQRTREMLSHAERTESFSQSLAEGKVGQIEIGYSGTVLHCGVDRLILEYRRAYPGIKIVAREVTTQQQSEMLRTGRLDAGLVSHPLAPPDFEYIELYEDRFVACVPSNHPLATRQVIDLSELRDEPFVIQARDTAASVYDQLVGVCAAAGFEPKVAFFSSHTLSTIWLVARGLGVALVLEGLSAAEIKGAVFIPLDLPLLRRRGFFVWNKDRQTPGLDLLITYIKNFACGSNSHRRSPADNQRSQVTEQVPESISHR